MIYRLLLSMLIIMGAASASARTERDYAAMPAPGTQMPYTLKVDSIDFRSDLVRVYGHLYGTPHTSARIDSFFIQPDARSAAPGGSVAEAEATDIDGFEFTHRFQWEDDGDIPVEIDFPPLAKADVYLMRIAYPNGWYGVTLRKVSSHRSRKAK